MCFGFPNSMILGFLDFKGDPEKFHRRKYHFIPHLGDGIPWFQNLSSSYGPNELNFPLILRFPYFSHYALVQEKNFLFRK